MHSFLFKCSEEMLRSRERASTKYLSAVGSPEFWAQRKHHRSRQSGESSSLRSTAGERTGLKTKRIGGIPCHDFICIVPGLPSTAQDPPLVALNREVQVWLTQRTCSNTSFLDEPLQRARLLFRRVSCRWRETKCSLESPFPLARHEARPPPHRGSLNPAAARSRFLRISTVTSARFG